MHKKMSPSKGKSLRAAMGELVIRVSSLISRQPYDRQNINPQGNRCPKFGFRGVKLSTAKVAVS